ncbi:hypothetical protein LguiA_006966 [Lonicera macranthoides]
MLVVFIYGDGGGPSNGSIFVGGFVLGGLIVGTLGYVYAPQVSKVTTGTNKNKLMRKLPDFIYNEENALEILFFAYSHCISAPITGSPYYGPPSGLALRQKKIAQLNVAIDDALAHMRSEDAPGGVACNSDKNEAAGV